MDSELMKNMTKRNRDLTMLIRRIDEKMNTFPDGSIRIKHDRKHTYYCLLDESKDKKERQLDSTKELELIRSLVQKAYLQKVRRQAQKEQSALQKAIDNYPDVRAEDVYESENDDRKDLINPIIPTDEQFKASWLAEPYEKKGITEGMPTFKTQNGEDVRSKSEKIIADALLNKGVPYKYECPLKLGEMTVYPDFTIMRMSDRTEVYYEHLGRMDDPVYVEKNINKINEYAKNGYCHGERLFTTMETKKAPLDTKVLDVLIDTMFR